MFFFVVMLFAVTYYIVDQFLSFPIGSESNRIGNCYDYLMLLTGMC